MTSTPRLESVSTKRQRIAALAKQAPTMAFTSLAHPIDLNWVQFYRLLERHPLPQPVVVHSVLRSVVKR